MEVAHLWQVIKDLQTTNESYRRTDESGDSCIVALVYSVGQNISSSFLAIFWAAA